VLVARLTPVISLDFIAYLAGLSSMRFDRYVLANVIGIAPGMFAYTILGNDLTTAQASAWRVSLILLCGVGLYIWRAVGGCSVRAWKTYSAKMAKRGSS
jgi:uncharacterized membrane protein YdjX (TVP38/TMEM64 family)